MKKYYLVSLFLVGNLYSYINNETGWEYFQGTQQAFYMFQNILIDSEDTYGDGGTANNYDGYCINNPYECDVIGAFVYRDNVEVCVGWNYVNSDSQNVTTLAIMGADIGLDDYLTEGEVPFLKVYDHTNDVVLPIELSNSFYSETLTDCNSVHSICSDDDAWDPSMGNGVWDDESPAEPFDDLDGDGVWDASEFDDLDGEGELSLINI